MLAGFGTLAISAAPRQACAQSVDYGALEQVFNEPVTTSATGKPQRASDAPANLTIIPADEIRRSGAIDIPDILRFVTGIDVRQYTTGQAEVAVHGYNQPFNPRLLVLVNGRQVYIDQYGFVAWSMIPVQLEEIRQIEVVKGPNSALFGFNAASGVINIVTYDPLFDHINTATARFGSRGLMQGSAVTTAHLGDNAGIRLSVGGLHQHEDTPLLGPAGFGTPVRNPQQGEFNVDTKARLTPDLEVMLEASSATAQQNETVPNGLLTASTFHTNSIKAGTQADTAWGTIAVDAYRNWLGYDNNFGVGRLSFTNTVYVLQASDTVRLNPDHTIRISLEYRNNSVTSSGVGGTIGYGIYSGSAMWDWRITPNLAVTNAVRIDYLTLGYSGTLVPGTAFTNAQYNNTTIAQPSFNSGLVYKVTSHDTVRLTAGRGLQVPSLLDFALEVPGAFGFAATVGSPTLQPTGVWNLELGYDRDVPAIGSIIRTSVFVQRNDKLLTPGGSTLPVILPSGLFASVAQNTGYSDAVGAEVGIKGRSASGFRWNASYALEVIRDHTTNNKIVLTSPQNYQDGTPISVVILGGGYTWNKLEIDAQARWQSRFTDYRYTAAGLVPVYVADYLTTRLRVGYNLTDHLTLALTGQQLNVPRVLQAAGPPVERSIIASATVHF
jgi:outer membrane receptor for ferrienterochelin and colicins